MNRRVIKGVLGIFFLVFIYICGNYYLSTNTEYSHPYMSWNLFLAAIPLLFATIAVYFFNKKARILFMVFFILWLLFYPNSSYIITDYIHIPSDFEILVDMASEENPSLVQRVFVFNNDFNIWVEFVIISIGVFLGVAAGLLSAKILEDLVRKKKGHGFSRLFILVLHLLTGYAITIGRFERWNSWDVFNPVNIYRIVVSHWNLESLKFTFLFASMSLCVYVIFSILMGISRSTLLDEGF